MINALQQSGEWLHSSAAARAATASIAGMRAGPRGTLADVIGTRTDALLFLSRFHKRTLVTTYVLGGGFINII